MNVELVAQMFNNYQSNVRFHLEGPRILRASMKRHNNTEIYL